MMLREPWTASVSVARSLLALSGAATYLLTPSSVLFRPVADALSPDRCAPIQWIAWPCWFPSHVLAPAQAVAGSLCLVVACGIAPALTAIPLCVLLFGLPLASSVPDGGDQIAAILGLLLVPLSIGDWRWWSWSTAQATTRFIRCRVLVSDAALVLAKVQVAVIYAVACVAKLAVPEWADGSAIYYWVRNNVFGAPPWVAPFVQRITEVPVLVVALTWGVLALEFALAVSMLLPVGVRVSVLLPIGLVFHAAIWFVLGIASFAVVMCAALLLLLLPIGTSVRPSAALGRWTGCAPPRGSTSS